MDIAIGLTEDTRKAISEHLSRLLANEYFLYLKTLNFHWNITGDSFISLHKLLEEHYEWLKVTVDAIAERIRTLGYTAPGTYKTYAKEATAIQEGEENQTAYAMLSQLVASHEAIIIDLRQTIKALDNTQDFATADMLIKWLGEHEKKTWMLRSHLQSKPQN